jgi:hypothetical protein
LIEARGTAVGFVLARVTGTVGGLESEGLADIVPVELPVVITGDDPFEVAGALDWAKTL